MSKQDKRIKKGKEADAAFAAILSAAMETVAEHVAVAATWSKPKDLKNNEWDVARAIRILREQNVAWWQVAHRLGLPGSADSLVAGKSGASYARRLYSKAFGALPKGIRAASGKVAAAERAETIGPWFAGRTVEEVAGLVAGKKLIFRIIVGDVETQDEAIVSATGAKPYRHDAISFHTAVYGGEPGKTKAWHPGPERIVHIDRIINVSAGLPTGVRV